MALFWKLGIVGIVLIIIVLVLLSPIVTIWALNTMFNLGIPLNIYTWLACAWLTAIITVGRINK